MKTLQSLVPRRLVAKKIAASALGALLIDQCRIYMLYPTMLGGYLKNNILFLKPHINEDKLALYQKKSEILAHLHAQLKIFGYIYTIKDIRL